MSEKALLAGRIFQVQINGLLEVLGCFLDGLSLGRYAKLCGAGHKPFAFLSYNNRRTIGHNMSIDEK